MAVCWTGCMIDAEVEPLREKMERMAWEEFEFCHPLKECPLIMMHMYLTTLTLWPMYATISGAVHLAVPE